MNEKLIFDLGLHTGQDTIFYLKKGFSVVAVEANPTLAAAARRKFAQAIEQGRVVLINRGVARAPGQASFYVNETNSSWSSFVKEIGTRGGNYERVTVETVTLGSLIEEHGVPYFLKIDIEGHDDIALESLEGRRDLPKFVSVENGYPKTLKRLAALGYDAFKFVDQLTVPSQRLPFPPREGRFAFHRFEFEASGAFGDEAPGKWRSFDEILPVIEAYWATPGLDAAVHGWRDLHARLGGGGWALRSY